MHGTDINIHAGLFYATVACMLPNFSSSGVLTPLCMALVTWRPLLLGT